MYMYTDQLVIQKKVYGHDPEAVIYPQLISMVATCEANIQTIAKFDCIHEDII